MTIPPNITLEPAPTAIKKLPSFVAVLIGIVLLLGGMLHFVIVTGFPHSWLEQGYVFTFPRLGPTQAVFDNALHIASVLGWFGFGLLFWGLVADGCILRQPRSKQIVATVFGIITLFCAILQLRVCFHWYWIVHYTLWAGHSFDPGSMFFTFPAALVCTVLAIILVGLRKSWLSWISLCLFALPLWQTLSMIPTWQDYISLKYGP
jgi:hypothetical protein